MGRTTRYWQKQIQKNSISWRNFLRSNRLQKKKWKVSVFWANVYLLSNRLAEFPCVRKYASLFAENSCQKLSSHTIKVAIAAFNSARHNVPITIGLESFKLKVSSGALHETASGSLIRLLDQKFSFIFLTQVSWVKSHNQMSDLLVENRVM